ncbi:MAG: AraC family transcriptional regulator [Asticcacaulis sp.]
MTEDRASAQRQSYAARIERVIAHLEAADLNDAPGLEALSAIAALSPFHFHRVYRLMTGETLNETLQRIRLARAVPALEQSIGRATEAAGYATSQGLARALKDGTGHTASDIRRAPDLRARLSDSLSRPAQGDAPLSIEIVTAEPLSLTALRNVGAYPELNAVYGRLFELVFAELPMESLRGLYGYRHDDPRFVPAAECRAEAAIDVGGEGALSGDLYRIDIPGGVCARHRHYGDYDAIDPAIDALYAAVIEAGHELADQPLLFHYLDDPEEVAEADLRCDLWLALSDVAGR